MIFYCFFIEIEIKKANENHINISHFINMTQILFEAQILLVHNVFWMIIIITPKMSIIDNKYQFNSTSWSLFSIKKDKRNKIQHISHVGYVYLQAFDFLL